MIIPICLYSLLVQFYGLFVFQMPLGFDFWTSRMDGRDIEGILSERQYHHNDIYFPPQSLKREFKLCIDPTPSHKNLILLCSPTSHFSTDFPSTFESQTHNIQLGSN